MIAGAALVACSNPQQPTSPRADERHVETGLEPSSVPVLEGIGIPQVRATSQIGVTPQAKPTDQVGFTNVVRVASAAIHVDPSSVNQGYVDCPVGSKATGGGHFIAQFGTPGARPFVRYSQEASEPTGVMGWEVQVVNDGTTGIDFIIYVNCAS
jgi:hypothetical protein